MGKKKSVVLMALLTIVIIALCALVAFPAFPIPNSPDSWNPVALQYDLDADLGGGYYVYYYPEGIIPESEYDELKESDQADYAAYVKDGKPTSLYLSTDIKDGVAEKVGENKYVPTEEFKTKFDAAVQAVADRFAQKEYSSMRYAVVDDFALRVELPKSELNVNGVLSALILQGDLSLTVSEAVVEELEKEGAKATDLIKSISIGTRYKVSYIKVQFTADGTKMIERLKSTIDSGSTLDIKVGEETIAQINKDALMPNNREARVFAVSQVDKAYLETFQIMLSDILTKGGHEIVFTTGDVRQFEPVYGENVLTLLYIALAIVLLALIALPIVFMGRYGGTGVYTTLSYFVITGICFAFIKGGVLEVSLGTVLIFLVGLALVNTFHYHVYRAIKKEFELGKTVESSVKLGYKKTLWDIIDVYAVLLLGALALLIGVANVYTLALQALICIITAAFCNLLWARAINFTFLSASKNKYQYFRFVREDEDDE